MVQASPKGGAVVDPDGFTTVVAAAATIPLKRSRSRADNLV
jgi:hypothetical protein